MKKLLLISSFLYCTAVASPTLAVDCTTVPSCSSLGYVDITSVSCDDGTFIKCPFDANYGICVKNSSEEGGDPIPTNECEVIAYGKTPARSDITTKVAINDVANYCPSGELCSYEKFGEALIDTEKMSGIIIFSDKAINTTSGATVTSIPSPNQAYFACKASEDNQDMFYPQFSTASDDMFVECEAAQRYTVAYTVPTRSSGIQNAIAAECPVGLCPKSSIEAYVANKTGYVVTGDGMYELSSGAITGKSVTTISSVKNIYYSCMTPCTAIEQLTLTGLTYPASLAHSYLYQKATAQCSSGLCPISTLKMAASSETGYMVAGEGVFKVNSGSIGSSLPSANVLTADSSKFYYACRGVVTLYDATGEETPQYISPCTELKVYTTTYTTPVAATALAQKAKTNCGGYLCSTTNTGTILSGESGYVVTASGVYSLSSGTIGNNTTAISDKGQKIYFACSNARSALAQLSLTVTYPASLTLGYIKEQARAKCPNGFADLFELESKVTTQTGYLFDSKCLSPVNNGVLSKMCVDKIIAKSADKAKIYYSCQSVPTATPSTINYGDTTVVY
ncbi:MAG: hypothetical protein IKC10_07950 [Alphaproteobacteria bacterium]|nr:hypothetical protein [Alphaproteobacteria bacterium]